MQTLDELRDYLDTFLPTAMVSYAFTRETRDAAAVGRGIASLLPRDSPVFWMRSSFLLQADGDWLKQALLSGQTVIVLCSGETDFPAALTEFWLKYTDDPRHTSGSAARNLRFEPLSAGQNTSPLIVVHLNRGDSPRPREAFYLALTIDLLDMLVESGHTAKHTIRKIGVDAPSANAAITMRDLCLMHTRDPEGIERKQPYEILRQATDPLTWTDAQTLLQSSAMDISVYDWLLKAGRMTDDQYGFTLAARNFSREQSAATAGRGIFAYPDIFEVIWVYEHLVPGRIYRGQFDANWPLETSLFRRKNDGSALDMGELHRRLLLTNHFLLRLREKQAELFENPLTDDELLAIAQHYGFPTSLMDFTYSFRTAAFFATLGAERLQADDQVGVIYALDFTPEQETVSPRGDPASIMGLDLHNLAGIYEGEIEQIVPRIAGDDDRIGRQQGLFVKGFRPRDFRQVTISAYYFRQTPSVIFEDPRMGITRDHLLPPNSQLAQLAVTVRAEFESQFAPLDPLLNAIPLTEPSIVGTEDRIRPNRLAGGTDFFDLLYDQAQAVAGDAAVAELRDIFADYFRAARTQADVGVLPDQQAREAPYEPLGRAVARLVNWSGLDSNKLWNILRPRLPDQVRQGYTRLETRSIADLDWSTVQEQIALACALYVVAWENLRYVHGDEARAIGQDAFNLLNRR